MAFVKATKKAAKLRLNLNGPAGAGKTYSALAIATHLGGSVAVIDTERGSASKYAREFDFAVDDEFPEDTGGALFNPKSLISKLDAAAKEGFGVVIVDSLSHFWNGRGGFLDLVDQEVNDMKNRGQKPDSFAAWKKVTPLYNSLIQKLLGLPAHLICTARAKMDYDKQVDNGKTKIVKLGLAPELRDGWQYEFDVEGMMNEDNVLIVGKTRCPELRGKTFKEPGKDVANILKRWLDDGEAPVTRETKIAAAVDAKVQSCLDQIAAASTLQDLEQIALKIQRAPAAFQQQVEAAYAAREKQLK